ncbi:MAG: hypothetical protein D6748_14495 [Calditrichaeota bacterium]|nr:MAG: hypothetical protein D6748_14495 [Calditrichota bacterium]
MRYFLLLLIALTLFTISTSHLYAQHPIVMDFKGGLNFSTFQGKDAGIYHFKPGFNGGIFIEKLF